jgi:DNA/RNA-binding domain of Phe-tRNA-synthetase-like protein
MDIAIDAELRGRVVLGVFRLDGVTVRAASEALNAEVDAFCAETRSRYGGGKSAEVPGAEDARRLYKALGIDPTKTRPSNEALLRRALKGEPLYRINTLVDALNLSSLRYQVPFGLYDNDRIAPPVLLRKGSPGESYEGIRKGSVNVDGRPVLVDAQGPFGNPTSDSARTCISESTRSALVVAYAPAAYSQRRLDEVLDGTEACMVRHCGGTRVERRILS